jgi:hypothetical protein
LHCCHNGTQRHSCNGINAAITVAPSAGLPPMKSLALHPAELTRVLALLSLGAKAVQ